MVNRALGLAVLLIAPCASGADEPLSYDEYQKAIGAGQERLDYSRRLIGHDDLHTLILDDDDGRSVDGNGDNPSSRESGSEASAGASDSEPEAEAGDNPARTENGNAGSSEADGSEAKANSVAGSESPSEVAPEPKPRKSKPQPSPAKPQVSSGSQARDNSREQATATRYISPSLRSAEGRGQRNKARVERSTQNRVAFGISLGTEISVSLDESATNVQPGLIKLKVDETIRGRKEDLPRGSTLFARSSAVIGSERLFLNAVKGVTPDGEEFRLQGVVFDEKREPGLAARIVSDGKMLARAGSKGLNTLGRELIDLAPTEGATGAATEATLDQMMKEKESGDRAQQGRPAYVVVASPQKATVQVETTF